MGRIRILVGISLFWIPLSMLSDGLTTLVLPHQLLSSTDASTKATLLGLITFGGLVLGMLVQPIAGVVSDRLRPRWGRRVTIALGVALILLALTFYGVSRNIYSLCCGYLLVQAAAGVAQAGQQGFIPDLVSPAWRGTASGFKNLADTGGALLAFLVLAQLLEQNRSALALVAIAAVLIGAFVLTILLVREPPGPLIQPSRRITVLDAFRLDLHRHRSFVWLIASRFLFLLGTYMVGRFLLYFVADRLNLDPDRAANEAGMLLAGLTVISVLAAPLAGWGSDRFGRIPLMLAGAAMSAAGVVLLATATSAWQILMFGGLMAIGSAAFAGANWALTSDLAPPSEAARFMALANIGTSGGAAAAGLFGPLIDWLNAGTPGTGYTFLFLAAGLSFLASAVALRDVARPPMRAAGAPSAPDV